MYEGAVGYSNASASTLPFSSNLKQLEHCLVHWFHIAYGQPGEVQVQDLIYDIIPIAVFAVCAVLVYNEAWLLKCHFSYGQVDKVTIERIEANT
jgi:hypothetical protein